MFHATPQRRNVKFIMSFHQSLYFFIVAPQRRRVRFECIPRRRDAAT